MTNSSSESENTYYHIVSESISGWLPSLPSGEDLAKLAAGIALRHKRDAVRQKEIDIIQRIFRAILWFVIAQIIGWITGFHPDILGINNIQLCLFVRSIYKLLIGSMMSGLFLAVIPDWWLLKQATSLRYKYDDFNYIQFIEHCMRGPPVSKYVTASIFVALTSVMVIWHDVIFVKIGQVCTEAMIMSLVKTTMPSPFRLISEKVEDIIYKCLVYTNIREDIYIGYIAIDDSMDSSNDPDSSSVDAAAEISIRELPESLEVLELPKPMEGFELIEDYTS